MGKKMRMRNRKRKSKSKKWLCTVKLYKQLKKSKQS